MSDLELVVRDTFGERAEGMDRCVGRDQVLRIARRLRRRRRVAGSTGSIALVVVVAVLAPGLLRYQRSKHAIQAMSGVRSLVGWAPRGDRAGDPDFIQRNVDRVNLRLPGVAPLLDVRPLYAGLVGHSEAVVFQAVRNGVVGTFGLLDGDVTTVMGSIRTERPWAARPDDKQVMALWNPEKDAWGGKNGRDLLVLADPSATSVGWSVGPNEPLHDVAIQQGVAQSVVPAGTSSLFVEVRRGQELLFRGDPREGSTPGDGYHTVDGHVVDGLGWGASRRVGTGSASRDFVAAVEGGHAVRRNGRQFWTVAQGRLPDETQVYCYSALDDSGGYRLHFAWQQRNASRNIVQPTGTDPTVAPYSPRTHFAVVFRGLRDTWLLVVAPAESTRVDVGGSSDGRRRGRAVRLQDGIGVMRLDAWPASPPVVRLFDVFSNRPYTAEVTMADWRP